MAVPVVLGRVALVLGPSEPDVFGYILDEHVLAAGASGEVGGSTRGEYHGRDAVTFAVEDAVSPQTHPEVRLCLAL